MSIDRIDHKPTGVSREIGSILPLTPAEIHLWLTFYDEVCDARLLVACRKLLNTAEQEQESRFYFSEDRRRYLVTRALVRTVLSRYLPVHPNDWVFGTNAYGRPTLINSEATDASLAFNISHTQGLIVLAVTRGRRLGVDVENFLARAVSMNIADHYFAPQEVADLNAVLPHQRQYRFFEYWTFKESYIKARGMGLSLPLNKLSFHYADNESIDLVIHPELGDDTARWQFWQFQPTGEYLLAVCSETIGPQPPKLIVRKAIPMISEEVIAPVILRATKRSSERASP